MRLSDLRRVAVRRGVRIRFRLANGFPCAVNQHGVAEVEGLNSVPEFDLERELPNVGEFLLEPAWPEGKGKAGARTVSREDLSRMAGGAGVAGAEDREESV
ncbi:MAG: hypothetical protein IT158_16270 [Bryobacterales bacterium]|nr:hypothetical protein [Bryobacterales bacterium]